MRAAVVIDWLGPEGLEVQDVPSPPLGDGEVRIRVRAAGVNFADVLMSRGEYQVKPPRPFAPGLEVAGEVMELGTGVSELSISQRVMAILHHGGFAEEAVTGADGVFPIPDAMSFEIAAGFAVVYGTAQMGLMLKARLMAGETVLVHGAAGGVGLAAVEVAKAAGCRVIATAGGAAKLAVAAEHGADAGIDYSTEDVRERTKQLTDGVGADVVFDPVGGDVFDASLRATRQGGRILVVGFASGRVPQIPANILLVKNIQAIGFYWGAHRVLDPALMRQSFAALFDWFEAGKLHPHISETHDLAAAPQALAALVERRATGKVVLTP